jgi:hypothetical protein
LLAAEADAVVSAVSIVDEYNSDDDLVVLEEEERTGEVVDAGVKAMAPDKSNAAIPTVNRHDDLVAVVMIALCILDESALSIVGSNQCNRQQNELLLASALACQL